MITAVLVDDMPKALQILQSDLEEHFPEIQILGKASSVVEAAKLLRKKTPDILFLDIMLGDGTGFDLLEIFPNLTSKIIFATAYEEHAIKAFRFAAVDYLLKPIDPEQFIEAVSKAKRQISSSNEHLNVLKETLNNPDKLPTRISLHSRERIVVVNISDIIRCESDGNNTMFFLKTGKKIFVTKTLKQFGILLKDHSFYRTHQSHLINIDHIQEYSRTEGGYLKMKNGDVVPVSVRKKAEVIELLDNLSTKR